ncbi:Holliday junction branch migration protein RuvA [Sphingomonas nostoxanthinifaciens]|uniref:Holliday junction branch migration protein RuvA n=1 Tax=Sphingomonas nostoxanthinifaciens TaxID=2872652 RepID=UPI001CC1DEDF|nr:Holliday junction branch migration protein RuvA [Sphingomonas nostoxanthinifaciens]UAK23726.1 Holliday junction branch migration protein RuvA [Sphingomonas nostoxanthinifaciens]
MIARLSGTLAETTADHAVLDVHGVGYLVQASTRTLTAIGPVGGTVTLFTEMQVREDAITLFGFGSAAERDWFRLLTSVQGVGGRVALAILSVLAPAELARAIAGGDKAMIARANGVGPKLALRIVTELKDRVAGLSLGPSGETSASPSGGASSDALAALASLGFRPGEASAAVAAAETELGPDAALDALVRLALRKAAR